MNTKIFIHENASENVICEMAAILFRGRWVNIVFVATYINVTDINGPFYRN